MSVEELREEALRLTPEARAHLARELLASLDAMSEAEIEKLWIDEAIRLAMPGDMVLVAGKGHERYQVIGTRRVPFDDHEVVQAALVRRRGPGRNGRAMARKAG